jgi:hypothetical protein
MVAFLARENIKIDICIPYGSDLYELPFKKFNFSSPIFSLIDSFQAYYQRLGLKNSRVMIMDEGFELYKTALKKLNKKSYNLGMPMVYNKELDNLNIKLEEWDFLDNHDFIVFNHARHWWKSQLIDSLKDFNEYGGLKRNDKVIIAFAKFLKLTKFKSPILVLFEYGVDVKYSKELITELGIKNYIKWMPTSPRKSIMYALQKTDFSSNAFREKKTVIGGVCYEAMASGSAHLNNFIDIQGEKQLLFSSAPMIHALSDNDILNIFLDYEENREKYKKIAQDAKKWFDKNLGEGLAKKYVELIKLLAEDKNLTQDDKIVQKVLSIDS